jgi:hypothetical protein
MGCALNSAKEASYADLGLTWWSCRRSGDGTVVLLKSALEQFVQLRCDWEGRDPVLLFLGRSLNPIMESCFSALHFSWDSASSSGIRNLDSIQPYLSVKRSLSIFPLWRGTLGGEGGIEVLDSVGAGEANDSWANIWILRSSISRWYWSADTLANDGLIRMKSSKLWFIFWYLMTFNRLENFFTAECDLLFLLFMLCPAYCRHFSSLSVCKSECYAAVHHPGCTRDYRNTVHFLRTL